MTDAASAASEASLLPITILTGFLGSGKTTLLSKLIRHPGMVRTAVIINEFGEVGLDHLLVESSTEDMVLLDGGCVCCTVRSDLVDTLRSLVIRRARGTVEFDRVVIETTGLADPAPIIHSLITDPLVDARFRLAGIVTTVDAVNGLDQLDRYFESVKQAAVADRIVLTKTDLSDRQMVAAIRDRLSVLNPSARVLAARQGEIDPAALFDSGLWDAKSKTADVRAWLNEEAYAQPHDHAPDHEHDHDHDHGHDHAPHGPHDARIHSFCLYFDQALPWERWAAAFDELVNREGARLLRIKGLLNVIEEEKPVVIHGVQHLFHPPATIPAWPDADRRSRVVFIADGIGRDEVEVLLEALLIVAPEPTPR